MKKRYKIPLLFVLLVVFLLIVSILVIANTKILEAQANYFINFVFVKDYPIKVKIGDIGGNLFTDISLRNLKIIYTMNGRTFQPLR